MSMHLVPVPQGDFDPRAFNKHLDKEFKRLKKKDRRRDSGGDNTLATISELGVVSTTNTAQQAILGVLQTPPKDAADRPITRIDTSNWNADNAAVLQWCANGVRTLGINTYNALSSIRTEVLLAFLSHGMDPRKKRGGLFGGGMGGISGLFVLSMLGGGGFGLTNLFGGQTQPVSLWGGIVG